METNEIHISKKMGGGTKVEVWEYEDERLSVNQPSTFEGR